MNPVLPLRFKIASSDEEIAGIRRLTYRTFVEEIPQHERNDEEILRDRFEVHNTYAICLRGDRVIGMISVCDRRPFSLDAKLTALNDYLPPHNSACEIRLLAVEREYRTGVVFRGLVRCIARHCLSRGYDIALLSGTERQLALYAHLGCVPFGPRVGAPGARFQPMYLMTATFLERGRAIAGSTRHSATACYTPGPVTLSADVLRSFALPAESHRGEAFRTRLNETRGALRTITGASRVQFMLGSGTLANDAVAAQLTREPGRGLVLTNGEFGDRLVDHASRASLDFDVHQAEWGRSFLMEQVAAMVKCSKDLTWLWAVHCETSTGVVNDIVSLRTLCQEYGVHLCLDCVSSIGSLPVDLRGVRFATGVSGKAIAAPPGVALVFHEHPITPSPQLPRYLDLGLYDAASCTPFTHSSNLLRALHAAVANRPAKSLPRADVLEDARLLRALLRGSGFHILGDDAVTSPAVTTIVLPYHVCSVELGERLEVEGFFLSYRSDYLQTRNWIQICLMGDYRRVPLRSLVSAMCELTASSMVA